LSIKLEAKLKKLESAIQTYVLELMEALTASVEAA
jgi:hypothetical protein